MLRPRLRDRSEGATPVGDLNAGRKVDFGDAITVLHHPSGVVLLRRGSARSLDFPSPQ
jgi:hypothetical protein